MIKNTHYYLFSGTSLFIERVGIPLLKKVDPYFLGSFVGRYLKPLLLDQIKNKNHKNILCHNRLTFQRDLEVLKQGDKFNYIEFNSLCIGQILTLYMPKWMRHQTLFKQYLESPEYADVKNKVEQFSQGFVNAVQKYLKIDCALMSGIDYYQDYGFHLVYKKMSIPFIAMFYENYTIPAVQIITSHLYRDFGYKFEGNGVAALSEKTAEVFRESKICSPSIIHITGAPRLDSLYKKMLTTKYGNKIVLFSYPGYEYGAHLNFVQVALEFAQASLKLTNMEFIIKCKNKAHEKQVIEYLEGHPHRIKILISIGIFDLLSETRSVISFNSLTCLEALLSKAHVYVPHFADSHLPDVQLQITPESAKNISGLSFLLKPGDMLKHLESDSQKTQPDTLDVQSRLELFKQYFHVSDTSSNRENLENLIGTVMENKHS